MLTSGVCLGMTAQPLRVDRPSKAAIGRIAENQPMLLNLLVAYFVFEWRSVRMGDPAHGIDQTGMTAVIPNYVELWTDRHDGILRNGIDTAVSLLLQCPMSRTSSEPGFVTDWLAKVSQE